MEVVEKRIKAAAATVCPRKIRNRCALKERPTALKK